VLKVQTLGGAILSSYAWGADVTGEFESLQAVVDTGGVQRCLPRVVDRRGLGQLSWAT
jgi:hypothetical protein